MSNLIIDYEPAFQCILIFLIFLIIEAPQISQLMYNFEIKTIINSLP